MVERAYWIGYSITVLSMVCLTFGLATVILLYDAECDSALIAYLTPRYYRLVWGLFASIVVAAFLANRLDVCRGIERPLYIIAADRVRSAWTWLALKSPLPLRMPVIALVLAAFIFFIPPQDDSRITYASPDVELPIAGSPQLIAESRGAHTPGFSRWRLGDQVFYLRSGGFGLGIISCETGSVISQGSLTHETANDNLTFSEMIAGVPDDIVTVVVAHDFSSAHHSDEFHRLLIEMGCTIEQNPDWNGAYILISERRHGRFSPLAELWGRHAILLSLIHI